MNSVTETLKAAHEQLVTLDGLYAKDVHVPDEEEPYLIRVTETVNKIEQALAVSERSLPERIEVEFNQVVDAKAQMQFRAGQIHLAEETAKTDNLEEWTAAKNNEVRRAIVLSVLADDEAYHEARSVYQEARDRYRLALLEIERLKLLVEARKAGDR